MLASVRHEVAPIRGGVRDETVRGALTQVFTLAPTLPGAAV